VSVVGVFVVAAVGVVFEFSVIGFACFLHTKTPAPVAAKMITAIKITIKGFFIVLLESVCSHNNRPTA
jgi:hypothetical protein